MSIQRFSSYTPFSGRKYDVFLSFRGEDTRKNFVDHLYSALDKKGIYVFRDDKELERGKFISSELFQAIEESRISIIILSKNYASSTWCLDELAKIVQCMESSGHMVLPIFYDVEPSVVRKQIGNFHEVFAKYEDIFKDNAEKVQKWRIALTKVANICGWDARNGYEAELIKVIVKEISNKLHNSASINIKSLVGINSRLEKLRDLIGTGSDVRMIGISGMGGIGKTTIARVIYMLISSEFEASCFVANVREISEKYDGLVSLQRQLLSQILRKKKSKTDIWNIDEGICEIRNRLQHRKVLIIIDDVTHVNQLENLVGECTWFGSGSRIIITTRNEHLLKIHGVNKKYDTQELNPDEAIQLLSLKAFKNQQPSEGYEELSNRVVSYANGLPLALEVLGSLLFGKTIDQWEDTLKRLSKDSNKEILNRLQISFDVLEESEKKIFLDIACFFKGCDRNYVTRILDGSGFNLVIGIAILVEKCLVTISRNNQLWMHDLLQQMGRQIVKKECFQEPGKRSRLWEEADVRHVLTKNTGTELVEGIMVEKELNLRASANSFTKMINLRLLKIHNVQLPEGIEYLSNDLRVLEWHGYPLKSLPPNWQLDEIVELDMSYGNIEQLWEGSQSLDKLNSIKLRECRKLTKTPDFTRVSNLEKVILEGCIMLREIHPSLFVHKKITLLNLRNCSNVTTFPSKIHMESLEFLNLSGCPELQSEEEESLEKLDIRGTATRQLTVLESFISKIENLKRLPIYRCKIPSLTARKSRGYARLLASLMPRRISSAMTFRLPSLSGCRCLTNLNLSDCNIAEGAIPDEIGDLTKLRWIDLSRNNFVSLPESISSLPEIDTFFLEGCKSLKVLPEISFMTSFLEVSGCVSLQTSPVAKRFLGLYPNIVCFFAVNCPKLPCSNSPTAFSVLKYYLMLYITYHRYQTPNFSITPFPRWIIHIAVPGSEIPKWCHDKDGSSITIKRHPNSYNNNKLVGYVACCVFVVNKHPHWEDASIQLSDRHRIRFFLSSVDQDICSVVPAVSFEAEKSGQALSEHTWLIFFSRGKSKEIFNPIKCSFKVVRGAGLEVKRCGARPLYKQEVEDLFTESTDSAFSNLNKFPYEDFVGTTMDDGSESSDSECSVSSCCDQETRAAAIDDLLSHLNEQSSELKDFAVRSTTDVIVNIKRSLGGAETSASACCDEETKAAVNNFLNTLVPEIKDFVRSTTDVITTKRSRAEREPGGNDCCDHDEPQPKRTKVEISFVGKGPRIEPYGFVL